MGIPWKAMALGLTALLCTDARAVDLTDGLDIYEYDDHVYPGWLCEDCRDPAEHPGDFAAFAYNAYWGEAAWAFGSQLGIPFRVYNSDLQWVVIWFDDFLFDGISLLPNTMDIRIRLETGEIVTITLVQGGPDLPIGGDSTTEPASCGCGSEEDGEDDDEDYLDDSSFEDDVDWDESDFEGVVEIVDPDDTGDFPEFDEEI